MASSKNLFDLKIQQLLKYAELPIRFLNLVDNPLNFTLKVSVMDLIYIIRLTYLERSELGVFIFINIAMFVVKLTDLIPENKAVNRRFLRN